MNEQWQVVDLHVTAPSLLETLDQAEQVAGPRQRVRINRFWSLVPSEEEARTQVAALKDRSTSLMQGAARSWAVAAGLIFLAVTPYNVGALGYARVPLWLAITTGGPALLAAAAVLFKTRRNVVQSRFYADAGYVLIRRWPAIDPEGAAWDAENDDRPLVLIVPDPPQAP